MTRPGAGWRPAGWDRHTRLAAVAGAGLLALAAGLLPAPVAAPLGALPALALLVVPAAVVDRARPVAGVAARAMLWVLVPVMELIVVGLVLLATPDGVGRTPWVLGLGACALVAAWVAPPAGEPAAGVAAPPGSAAPPGARLTGADPAVVGGTPRRGRALGYRHGALALGCAAALTAALALSIIATGHRSGGFTELARTGVGTVSVANAETGAETLQLRLLTPAGSRSWAPFRLAAGSAQSFALPPLPDGTSTLQLLRLPAGGVYRSLTLRSGPLPAAPPVASPPGSGAPA